MNSTELVSIVIPTYGRTEFLRKTLASVCNQTYPDIEIILVDDNAERQEIRNQVIEIAKEYSVHKLILNEKNQGAGFSRNEGIKAAQGAFISFLDDDDIYHPERIEKCLKQYKNCEEKNNIGFIYSFSDEVTVDGNKMREYRITVSENPLYQHMCSCIAGTPQWIIPKHIFNQVGMFEDSIRNEDSIMLLKILGAGYRPLCVEEVLVHCTQHDTGRLSGIGEANVIGMMNVRDWCRKYYDKITVKEQKIVETKLASQILTYQILLGNKKEAKKQLGILLRNCPFSKNMIKSLAKYCIGKNYLKLAKRK